MAEYPEQARLGEKHWHGRIELDEIADMLQSQSEGGFRHLYDSWSKPNICDSLKQGTLLVELFDDGNRIQRVTDARNGNVTAGQQHEFYFESKGKVRGVITNIALVYAYLIRDHGQEIIGRAGFCKDGNVYVLSHHGLWRPTMRLISDPTQTPFQGISGCFINTPLDPHHAEIMCYDRHQ